MGFSRQEYRSGRSCFPPGDLPNPGIKPSSLISLALPEGSLPLVPSYNSAILILGIYLKNEKQQQQQKKPQKIYAHHFQYSAIYISKEVKTTLNG